MGCSICGEKSPKLTLSGDIGGICDQCLAKMYGTLLQNSLLAVVYEKRINMVLGFMRTLDSDDPAFAEIAGLLNPQPPAEEPPADAETPPDEVE